MKPQTLIDFFNERNQSLTKCFKRADADNLEETLHKLRVDIKKIHFLLLFIGYFNHRKNIHDLYLPYRKIFKSIGVIRELQLKQKLLIEYDPGKETIKEQNKLLKKEKKLAKNFLSHIHEYLKLIDATNKIALTIFEKFPVFNEMEFLHSLSLLTKRQFSKINVEHLHESRKTLKTIIYSKQLFPHAAVFRKILNVKVADDLQDLIGAWHDKTVLADWMNQNSKSSEYATIKVSIKNAAAADFKLIKQASSNLFRS
ncbi:MAG: CHAD domain-containing protein [Bacteroidia bacterium]